MNPGACILDAFGHASAVMGRGKNLLFPMPITHYPFPINDLN